MDRKRTSLILALLNLFSLVTFAEPCPRDCDCEGSTRTVSCRNKGNTPQTFDKDTRIIDFSGNRITNCYKLSPYPNLTRVILSNNRLSNVSRACFNKNVLSLELLDLSYNRLRALPNLTHGPVIKVLNLTGNRIVSMQPISWYGLNGTRELILDNNGLRQFTGGELFQDHDALEVLSLRGNSIRRLCTNGTNGLFYSAVNLKELYLSNNSLLARNATWLIGAPNLEILDLRNAYCPINYSLGMEGISWRFPGVSTRLKYLDLSQNELITLGDFSFSGCENLEIVNLTDCSLREFKGGQFQEMKKLTHLYADYNYVSEIDSALFFDLRKLRVLSMRFNNLGKFSTKLSNITFSFIKSLEVIDFSNNYLERLTFLPSDHLRNLTRVSVDYNRISDAGIIVHFPNLEHFSAARNSIKNIPNINAMHQLRDLNLAHNEINVLDISAFWATCSPVTIDLTNNKINSISRRDISEWEDAGQTTWSVVLTGNPLKCACSEQWFNQETQYKVYNSSLTQLYENILYTCVEGGHNISYALDSSDCVFIHRDALIVLGCLLLLLACCAVLAAGMTIGKRMERRHRTNGGSRRGNPESEKKLVTERDAGYDKRSEASPARYVADKDQHLKDALSLSNLKGSMVRLDNENVKPFFREIYV